MTTLVSRADLDAPRGSTYIDELLREAYKSSDTQPDKDAAALARLNAALADADAVARRHLDARDDWTAYAEADLANLRPLARDWAIVFLKAMSRAGASDADMEMRKQITLDLVKMRERGLWTGSTVFQEPTAAEAVPSGSSFSFARLTGLT